MSQPPKSTILAPRARWASLRMVFWVMAGSSGAKTGLSQTRARLVGAHWGATGFPGKAVAPQCAPTTTIPSGDRFDQQGHALDRKSVVSGKSVSVRVDLGGRRIIKKTNTRTKKENRRNMH